MAELSATASLETALLGTASYVVGKSVRLDEAKKPQRNVFSLPLMAGMSANELASLWASKNKEVEMVRRT